MVVTRSSGLQLRRRRVSRLRVPVVKKASRGRRAGVRWWDGVSSWGTPFGFCYESPGPIDVEVLPYYYRPSNWFDYPMMRETIVRLAEHNRMFRDPAYRAVRV